MKLTLRPKTKLGKLSAWGIVFFLFSWSWVAFLQPLLGGEIGTPNFWDWLLLIGAFAGMLAAFFSLVGSLIAIVWWEDRSLLGILAFIFSIPIVVLLAGFLLGGLVG